MARAAASMSGELTAAVDKAADAKPWSLMVVAMLAVGREGLETALFIWAATQASSPGHRRHRRPAARGAARPARRGAARLPVLPGCVRINLTRFFTWTGAFLIIVAGGVLAYGIHDLQEAGILPGLNNLAFDVTHLIPPTSVPGTLLKGIFNFSPATTWLEATAWVAYVVPTMILFLFQDPPSFEDLGPPGSGPRRLGVIPAFIAGTPLDRECKLSFRMWCGPHIRPSGTRGMMGPGDKPRDDTWMGQGCAIPRPSHNVTGSI